MMQKTKMRMIWMMVMRVNRVMSNKMKGRVLAKMLKNQMMRLMKQMKLLRKTMMIMMIMKIMS